MVILIQLNIIVAQNKYFTMNFFIWSITHHNWLHNY